MLAVLCLSLSLPYFNLLHHFTTTTGLKEEEGATARLGTDSVGDEDRRRRRQGREELGRSTSKGTKTPKSAQESSGKTV